MDKDSYACLIDVLLVLSLLVLLAVNVGLFQLIKDYGKCQGELKTYKPAEKPKEGVQ